MLMPVVCVAESFTIEQVLSAPFPYGLRSASHAPRVAWVFDNKGERNIWVADAPGFVPRQITHYKGVLPSGVSRTLAIAWPSSIRRSPGPKIRRSPGLFGQESCPIGSH